MIPMEIRKIIVADYEDGMEVKTISQAVRVSTSTIYRLLEKNRKTGTIEPSYCWHFPFHQMGFCEMFRADL